MQGSFTFGGDKGSRTPDLLNAIQALSQLSYTPVWLVLLFRNGDIIPQPVAFVNRFLESFLKDFEDFQAKEIAGMRTFRC